MLYHSHDDSWSQEANGTPTDSGPRVTFSDDTNPTTPTSAPNPATVTPSPGLVVHDMLSAASSNASQTHSTTMGRSTSMDRFMLPLVTLLMQLFDTQSSMQDVDLVSLLKGGGAMVVLLERMYSSWK